MFKNYLKVAVRNLMRKKRYAFINVFGLSLGLACCILMTLFVKHEWTHDWFHKNREQLFRVVAQRVQPDGTVIPIETWDLVYPLWVVDALKDDVPGIVAASAFIQNPRGTTTKGEKTFRHKIGLVNVDFLAMFTFPLLAGDAKTALDRPDGIVINETVARKFFGNIQDENTVIGQSLMVRNKPFVVTGVIDDVSTKSSLQFDLLVSVTGNENFGPATYRKGIPATEIYVQIDPFNVSQVLERLKHWTKKERVMKDTFKDNPINFILQPMTDVYWNINIPSRFTSQTHNPTGVYILWGLAGLVLFIACSNFITLSVSESSGRAKEVGLRKMLGANRTQVIQQFWSEALLLSFLGLVFGVALAEILLPVFNEFVEQQLTLSYFDDWALLVLLLGVVGLLAGSYPAIILSRFQPVLAIKGEAQIGGRNRFTRALIILQYGISIALIIGAGIVIEQQHYMRNKNLGFNKEHVAVVRANRRVAKSYKQEIAKDPRLAGVTISDRILIDGYSSLNYKLLDGKETRIRLIGTDEDYLSTLEIPLLEGRNFSEDHPSDRENSVLINETLAKQLGIENPVGKTLSGFVWENLLKDPVIIGVVRDFHTESLHEQIVPVVLQMRYYKNGPFLLVRMRAGEMLETIEMLKGTWGKMETNMSFSLSFLDERLDQQYRDEMYWFRVLSHSAFVAVALSCLGLFGLASLAVARRTKEVGIRKALGASIGNVMWLLSKDFVKLLLFANVIAWPVAYWATNKWLTNFAYRVELGAGVFLIASLLTLVIALLTINAQTLKAARANPVDALRNE